MKGKPTVCNSSGLPVVPALETQAFFEESVLLPVASSFVWNSHGSPEISWVQIASVPLSGCVI